MLKVFPVSKLVCCEMIHSFIRPFTHSGIKDAEDIKPISNIHLNRLGSPQLDCALSSSVIIVIMFRVHIRINCCLIPKAHYHVRKASLEFR